MTATGHAVIGTVIAAQFANPYIGIPLALISHLAADAFPHWDPGTNGKKKTHTRLIIDAAMDVIFGFTLSYLLLFFLFPQTGLLYAFIVIIAAQFFDWLTAPYYFFHIKLPPFTWGYQLQKHFDNRLDKPWGIINQVAVLLVAIILAKVF